ncbi:MAG: radical SAM protein [Rickettsiales bacterium]|jgi:threonylcarbamoyladenosine tRNA methylthiotransferase MtaB|nr:radical SAM protein [Rickettsiales bacterium]
MTKNASKIIVKAFGCRLNAAETAKLEIVAARAGLSDAVIFNTCAVTSEAERQAKQAIRKAARANPKRAIYVVGCGADRDPKGFAELPGVVKVIGNKEKFNPKKYNDEVPGRPAFGAVAGDDIIVDRLPDYLSKGFVQIQTGCDYACTFCIVHTLRGRSRSFPYAAISEQTRRLVSSSYAEIVLTGVDIAGYKFGSPSATNSQQWTPAVAGVTGGEGLVYLVKRLLADVPDLRRLRLSSLDPAKDWEPLMDLMAADSRVLPHLHLSMQSGSDEILRMMGRRHRAEDLTGLAKYNRLPPCGGVGEGTEPVRGQCRLNRPPTASPFGLCDSPTRGEFSVSFSVDIICGFPGETDERFAETIAVLEKLRPIKIHAFPFSARDGTPAATFPNQVPKSTAKERVRRLGELESKFLGEFMKSQIGKKTQVLMERGKVGRTPDDIPVLFDAENGEIVEVVLTGIKNGVFLTK